MEDRGQLCQEADSGNVTIPECISTDERSLPMGWNIQNRSDMAAYHVHVDSTVPSSQQEEYAESPRQVKILQLKTGSVGWKHEAWVRVIQPQIPACRSENQCRHLRQAAQSGKEEFSMIEDYKEINMPVYKPKNSAEVAININLPAGWSTAKHQSKHMAEEDLDYRNTVQEGWSVDEHLPIGWEKGINEQKSVPAVGGADKHHVGPPNLHQEQHPLQTGFTDREHGQQVVGQEGVEKELVHHHLHHKGEGGSGKNSVKRLRTILHSSITGRVCAEYKSQVVTSISNLHIMYKMLPKASGGIPRDQITEADQQYLRVENCLPLTPAALSVAPTEKNKQYTLFQEQFARQYSDEVSFGSLSNTGDSEQPITGLLHLNLCPHVVAGQVIQQSVAYQAPMTTCSYEHGASLEQHYRCRVQHAGSIENGLDNTQEEVGEKPDEEFIKSGVEVKSSELSLPVESEEGLAPHCEEDLCELVPQKNEASFGIVGRESTLQLISRNKSAKKFTSSAQAGAVEDSRGPESTRGGMGGTKELASSIIAITNPSPACSKDTLLCSSSNAVRHHITKGMIRQCEAVHIHMTESRPEGDNVVLGRNDLTKSGQGPEYEKFDVIPKLRSNTRLLVGQNDAVCEGDEARVVGMIIATRRLKIHNIAENIVEVNSKLIGQVLDQARPVCQEGNQLCVYDTVTGRDDRGVLQEHPWLYPRSWVDCDRNAQEGVGHKNVQGPQTCLEVQAQLLGVLCIEDVKLLEDYEHALVGDAEEVPHHLAQDKEPHGDLIRNQKRESLGASLERKSLQM